MARLVIENLTKVFPVRHGTPVRAVDGVGLALEDHEFVTLAGPSGCGKSTLLRLIAGLETPSQGSVIIDGKLQASVPPKDRDIAMVFQGHSLYPHLTAYENLAFGLTLRKVPKPEVGRRVLEASERLGLRECLQRLPQELSGGEKQRVALGRALVLKPRIFLLDEPFSHLDATLRSQLRRDLVSIHASVSATMIYVTHDQTEAMTLGQRLAVMNQGAILQFDNPLHVYQKPTRRFVAGFIGSPAINMVEGSFELIGGRLCFRETPRPAAVKDSAFELPVESASLLAQSGSLVARKIACGLRPELLSLTALTQPSTPDLLRVRIEFVEHLGHEQHVQLTTGSGLQLVARAPANSAFARGEHCGLRVDHRQACFFDSNHGRLLH